MFICSHILTELSKIATRYGFIHKGKLIQEVEAKELESKGEGMELERYFMELIYKYDTAMASQPYYAAHNYFGGVK